MAAVEGTGVTTGQPNLQKQDLLKLVSFGDIWKIKKYWSWVQIDTDRLIFFDITSTPTYSDTSGTLVGRDKINSPITRSYKSASNYKHRYYRTRSSREIYSC